MSLLQDPKANLDSDWNPGDSGEVTSERQETKSWIIPSHALSDLNEFLKNIRRYGHQAWKAMDFVPGGTASSFMDMIQHHLNSAGSHEDRNLRKTCIHCLLRLNKRHFSLPPSLHLADVVKEGSHPAAGGGFADIWKGRLKDDRLVCLKVLRVYTGNFDKNKLMKQLGNEILIWRQLRHPNIHEFLGVTSELFEPSYCTVSPWMANGDVMSYCRECNSSLDVKVVMIRELCDGLQYLHEYNPPIVHSDIKGMNILVSDDGRCRISDFGLSTIENDSPEGHVSDSTSQAAMRGSIPWLAPELMNPGGVESPNRTTRDIYALGCTMYEILAGTPPFTGMIDPQIIIMVLRCGRPSRPAGCPDELWTTIENCWTEDSGSRPVASQVASLLVKVTFPTTPKPVIQHPQTGLSDYNDPCLSNIQQEDDSSDMVESAQQHPYHSPGPHMESLSKSRPLNLRVSIASTSYSHSPQASFRATPTQTNRFRQTSPGPGTMLYSLPPMMTQGCDESQHSSLDVTGPSLARLQPPLSRVNQRGKTRKRHRLLAIIQKQAEEAERIGKLDAEILLDSGTFEVQASVILRNGEGEDAEETGRDDYEGGMGDRALTQKESYVARRETFRMPLDDDVDEWSLGNSTAPHLDPIWDDTSVRDAWKEFRSRVGMSELVGVPSTLLL
ncbi:Homeobox protein tos8 [Marasmius sp. AFHP31]|nr:Homeobox protein tos8 [Marasmius sp. AFHP31]